MVGSSFTEYDSVYGKSLKKNFSTTRITPEFIMDFSTNSEGFRGPEVSKERAFVFLGDSFTMGYGVSDGEEFPMIVGASLAAEDPAIPVVNLGMGDNGNGRWIKLMRNKVRDLDPRAIVIQLTENDFRDNRTERLFELSADGELVELPVPPISTIRRIQNFVDAIPGLADLHLVGLAYQAVFMYRMSSYAPPEDIDFAHDLDPLTYRILEEVISIADQEGWPLIAMEVGIEGSRLDRIESMLAKKGIPLIRTPSKEVRPDLYYVVDGHWNPKGHRLAAELVLKEIRRFEMK